MNPRPRPVLPYAGRPRSPRARAANLERAGAAAGGHVILMRIHWCEPGGVLFTSPLHCKYTLSPPLAYLIKVSTHHHHHCMQARSCYGRCTACARTRARVLLNGAVPDPGACTGASACHLPRSDPARHVTACDSQHTPASTSSSDRGLPAVHLTVLHAACIFSNKLSVSSNPKSSTPNPSPLSP